MTIDVEKVDKILNQIKTVQGAFSAGILSIEEQDELVAPLKKEIKEALLPGSTKEPPAVPGEEGKPQEPPAGPPGTGAVAAPAEPTTQEGANAGAESNPAGTPQ